MNIGSDLIDPTKIKQEDATLIIDLDLDKSPEDVVYEWDSKVRVKFKKYVTVDSEQSLDALMKWYIQAINEEAATFEDCKTLKLSVAKHIQFLKLYFVELNCCFADNYLDNMEEILTFYVNLEIRSLPAREKDGNRRAYKKGLCLTCKRIITILKLYLLNRGDRMSHVMIKLKSDVEREESRDLLNILYGNFLTKEPKDKSDLEFCRTYILYQKWKTLRKPEDWEKMDEVMYNLHGKTPECIEQNHVLKQILLPQNNSILNALVHITEKHLVISKEYFRYIKSNNVQDDGVLASEISHIEIQDDDILQVGNEEDQQFERAYRDFVKSMSSVCIDNDKPPNENMDIKTEVIHDEDDCQIVGVTTLGGDSQGDIVHEILDDDDDDIELIYFKARDVKQNPSEGNREETATVSFLNSINVTERLEDHMETVSSSTNGGSVSELHAMDGSSETTADSPTSNFVGQDLSKKPCKTATLTSVAQTDTTLDVISEDYEPDKSVGNNKNEIFNTKTVSSAETAKTSMPESNPCPSKTKSVVSIETQTEEWYAVDKLSLEKSTGHNGICNSYYYYGLVTPPSDQPHDEHIPPTTETTTYPNVYANIVRTHSPETDNSLTKSSETEYLPSMQDNETDNENLPSGSRNVASDTTQQNKSDSSECSLDTVREASLTDMAFIPEIEPNTKKKLPDVEKQLSVSKICINTDESLLINQGESTAVDADLSVQENPALVNEDVEQLTSCTSPVPLHRDVYHSSNSYSSSQINVCTTSPSKHKNIDSVPEASTSTSCTLHGYIRSQDFSSKISSNSNDQGKLDEVSCTSPDVTSTSVDVQGFSESVSNGVVDAGENILVYNHVVEGEDHVHNGNYSVGYVEYSTCSEGGEAQGTDSITQSNLEDVDEDIYIEGPVLMANEEELTYIVDEALPFEEDIHVAVEEVRTGCDASSVCHSHRDDAEETENESVEEHATPSIPLKQLKVALEKMDPCQSTSVERKTDSPSKIMYTSEDKIVNSSMDEFSKFQERMHSRWSQLKDTHDLDNIFCGPVSKMNGTNDINPDSSFDLFGSESGVCESSENTDCSEPIMNEVTSPAYERIDDFKTYYEQNMAEAPVTKNKVVMFAQRHNLHSPIGGKVTSSFESFNDGKRSRTKNNVLQGILKKPLSNSNQGVRPASKDGFRVVLTKLSQTELSRWEKLNKISQMIREEKQRKQMMEIVRVDYDKQTVHINKNDMVRYNPLGGIVKVSVPETNGHLLSNSVSQIKSTRFDEGLRDLPYTEKKTGKRKRPSSLTANNTQSSKRGRGRPRTRFY